MYYRDAHDKIHRMWNDEHMTQRQIAAVLGMTRSRVAGYINRAKGKGLVFEKRINYQPAHTSRSRNRPKPTAKRSAIMDAVIPVPVRIVPPSGLVTLMEHEDFQCRAVHSFNGVTMYCAFPRVDRKKSYCAKCSIGMLRVKSLETRKEGSPSAP
jgi:DNA-binding MarR family transcriptional regulator